MRSSIKPKRAEAGSDVLCQVITTVAKQRDVDRISSVLLEGRLVACVQVIGPVVSSYWWKGKIRKEKEFLILAKTSKKLYPKVEKTIKSVHPYEVPEIIALQITDLFGPYARWIEDVLSKGRGIHC